jgi:hypothetical protein
MIKTISTTAVYARFEFLTAVTMKSTVLWDATPCSPVEVHLRFGAMCGPHLYRQRVSQARK